MGLDPEAVFSELGELMRRVCEHPLPDLSMDSQLDEILGIDSLRLLQTVAQMEEHFDVEIDVAALDRLITIGDIVRAVVTARPADTSGTSMRNH
jgi:acyl carrier protein